VEGVVNPLKTTFTVIMVVAVSQVTNAVPVADDVGCGGFSLRGLSPGASGPVAMNVRVAAELLTANRTRRGNTHTHCFMSGSPLRC
jgi:hypothetical protein